MNKERRNRLRAAVGSLTEAVDIVTDVMDGEQEALDNLPEPIAECEVGQKMEENIDELDAVLSDLEAARDRLESIID